MTIGLNRCFFLFFQHGVALDVLEVFLRGPTERGRRIDALRVGPVGEHDDQWTRAANEHDANL